MYTFLLQDWVTVRAAPSFLSVNQSADGWLDLTGFQDAVAWAEVKTFTTGGGSGLALFYQTSPTRDETQFQYFFSGETGAAAQIGLNVSLLVTNASATVTPLARWLRWQLLQSGSAPAQTWDATFRVFISANPGGGGRKSIPGMPIAPAMRAGGSVSAGAPGSIQTSTRSGELGPGAPGSFRAAGTKYGRPMAVGASAVQTRGSGSPSVPLHLQPTATRVSPLLGRKPSTLT